VIRSDKVAPRCTVTHQEDSAALISTDLIIKFLPRKEGIPREELRSSNNIRNTGV